VAVTDGQRKIDYAGVIMFSVMLRTSLATAGLLAAVGCATDMAPRAGSGRDMTFFVTSIGLGKGADLGGLDGADLHCQSLAKAVGAGNHTWRAYLSTQGASLSDPKVVPREQNGRRIPSLPGYAGPSHCADCGSGANLHR
jgi:hypothetical protein